MADVRAHIYVIGTVQGVWFRASTVTRALALEDISGWVKNRLDGRVELMCEGPREKIDKLIEWLWQGPELAKVADVRVEWGKAIGDFALFSVQH